MGITAAVGMAVAVEAREAGSQAARQALEQIGREPVSFALVIVSSHLNMNQVMMGISAQLGDKPILGFSAAAEICGTVVLEHAVVVMLVAGVQSAITAAWQSEFDLEGLSAADLLIQTLFGNLRANPPVSSTLILTADGFAKNAGAICAAVPPGQYVLAGCLAGAGPRQARSFQADGRHSGFGGAAGLFIESGIVSSVGMAHGWQPVGPFLTLREVSGKQIQSVVLDNNPQPVRPADALGSLFGFPSQEWTRPPLNQLVRLYPLGVGAGADRSPILRSANKVEKDGSLNMVIPLLAGSTGQLMVGSVQACMAAARQATQQALNNLNGARPVLGLVFCDQAWSLLMQNQPGSELTELRQILGPAVPLAGAYIPGQIAHSSEGNAEIYSHHIQVVLFGEPGE